MTLDESELKRVATRMLADYDAGTPGQIFAEGFRLGLTDAWRLQTAVTRLREARGEVVIGYKVGAVDPGNQQMMGLPHPVWGRLWDSELHESGAILTKSDYANISIEAEFGIVLARDLTPGMSSQAIAEAVQSVFPVLELHNQVMRSERPHGQELIANNCINCGVVRGAPVTALAEPKTTDLKLIYDDNIVDEWEALSWPTDILAAMPWLISSLDQHGIRLRTGDLVLTSAWGPPIPVDKHSRVDVASSALGSASATFT
ncbi:MAG: 2-keto-4-pentenoate hydratase [Burkholderiaceae bacterium]